MTELPNRVREHRLARGWTQDELAKRAGLTPGQISRIETGKRPTMLVTTALRVAAAFEVSVDDLYHRQVLTAR